MSTIIDTIITWHTRWPALIEAALVFTKTGSVIVMAWLMVSVLRKRSAKARAWIWRLALLALAALALWQIRPGPMNDVAIQVTVIDYKMIDAAPPVLHTTPVVLPPDPWHLTTLRLLDRHLSRVWLLGFVVIAAWKVLRSLTGLAWLRRHSRLASEDIARECPSPLRCRTSDRIHTPLITGLLRSIIWLPEESIEWSPLKRRAAFQHELAHHHRRDNLWQWLGTLAACAWWWQPLGWLALRFLKAEAEHAADDHSLATITAPDYAEALVDIAKAADARDMHCAGIAMARTSELEHRVRSVLAPNRWRNKLGYLACGALVLLGISTTSIILISCKKQPPRYVSLAKVVAGGRMVANTNGAPGYVEYLQDFYGTIIETLESRAMALQAAERVHALNPELKTCDVEIKVTQNKGSAIFNIAATGSEPKYTRVFLDALLDEFRAFRDSIREQQRNKAVTAMAEDVVKRETSMKEKGTKLAEFKKNNNIVVVSNNQNQSAELLKQLGLEKNRLMLELSDMEFALKDIPQGMMMREQSATSGRPDRIPLTQIEQDYLKARSSLVALKAQVTELQQSSKPDHPEVTEAEGKLRAAENVLSAYVRDIRDQFAAQTDGLKRRIAAVDVRMDEFTKQAVEYGAKLSEYERLQKDCEESEKAFKDMFDLVHKFQVGEEMSGDYVSIMQRAEAAVEDVPKSWFR